MAPTAPQDPRSTVTPDAFQVAPELLGLPLAGPWRRLLAMLVDLLLLAVLVNAGGVFLAIAGAVTVFRATSGGSGSRLRRGLRATLRWSAALVLFIAVLALWSGAEDLLDRGRETVRTEEPEDGEPDVTLELGLLGGLATLGDLRALATAEDREEARPAARRIVERIRQSGASPEQLAEIRLALDELSGSRLPAWSVAALREAVAEVAPAAADGVTEPLREAPTDSLARAYAAALGSGDSAAAARLGPLLAMRLAADTLARLDERLVRLGDEAGRLRSELRQAEEEAERRTGVRFLVSFVADDLGLGFGWAGLYFTAFVALMKGQTPGKRLLGMRVIRLDGKPMGWWASFERFGGYGASIVTGLMGFLQILWDRNRQGMHDKISETVVVRV